MKLDQVMIGGAGAMASRRRRALLAGIMMVGALALGQVVPATPAGAAPFARDARIADVVETELLTDQAVDASRIDVAVVSGKVFLGGRVGNALARRRAAQLAETVRGVVAVVNDITVVPPVSPPPIELAEAVESALAVQPALESYEINVEATGPGTIRLSGAVDSWVERRFAERTALGVAGVRRVDNLIAVLDATAAERADSEIREDVAHAIAWNANLEGNAIDVAVEDGTVVLTGEVGSAAEKRLANSLSWVADVDAVDDSGLEVVAERPAPAETEAVQLSVGDIADAVRAAMVNDPRVAPASIEVDVEDGVVILRGSVRRLSETRVAEKVASDTVGVRRVKNRLKVRPAADIDKAELERSVEAALARDPFVGARDIAARARDGEVSLSGAVDSYYEKARADQVVAEILGVRRINNGLTVRLRREPLNYEPFVDTTPAYRYRWYDYEPGPSWKSDGEIRADIIDQLWWSPFVDADKITVSVEDGVATLSGVVDGWREYNAARENAFDGGATWVRNKLVVVSAAGAS